MSQKPETVFRQRVVKDIKKLPFTAYFPIQQRTIQGDPDLILCIRSLFVALELKSEKGEASALQKYKLEEIRKAEGYGFVVFPKNWGGVYKILKSLARGEEK